ncbi:MAG: ABC transporter substrate-binding protein [Kiritimatiellia bacterium]
MWRNFTALLVAAFVIALPFTLRQRKNASAWKPGDPVLVLVSPHNKAIEYEFGQAFSRWHEKEYGQPVKTDWRSIGGTTEIMRYLAAQYVSAFRAWWIGQGKPWPAGTGEAILDERFASSPPSSEIASNPEALRQWQIKRQAHTEFRRVDDANAFGAKIDLFFGGGAYDHEKAWRQGLTVEPWPPDSPPPDTIFGEDAGELIPERLGGEKWRSKTFFGNALSTFGICYNLDRLKDLGIAKPPRSWSDLTDPRYFGQLGVADPTKSGSIAKAFEMIIYSECYRTVVAAGYAPAQIAEYETRIQQAGLPPGVMCEGVPSAYQEAVEQGWLAGLNLVRLICANARYFTDSASKVPIDVSMGDAAAGIAIDFYGRYQAQYSCGPNGEPRMVFVTPVGGSSVSADPISLLRGAPNREIAIRFIRFVLSEDGQKLWNYQPGTPGGPVKFALRRLPIRRDFYPSENPHIQTAYERHRAFTTDDLGQPGVNPYELAYSFPYYPRWTARHFNVQRDLIRIMCMDAGEELRAAWRAIIRNGGPQRLTRAMQALNRLPSQPEPLDWRSALTMAAPTPRERLAYMREWTVYFRQSYREAREIAESSSP